MFAIYVCWGKPWFFPTTNSGTVDYIGFGDLKNMMSVNTSPIQEKIVCFFLATFIVSSVWCATPRIAPHGLQAISAASFAFGRHHLCTRHGSFKISWNFGFRGTTKKVGPFIQCILQLLIVFLCKIKWIGRKTQFRASNFSNSKT